MDARYDTYDSLFEHPGWALFLQEFISPSIHDVPVAAFEHAVTIEEIVAARIVRDKLQIIEDLPRLLREQREENRAEAEREAAHDGGYDLGTDDI